MLDEILQVVLVKDSKWNASVRNSSTAFGPRVFGADVDQPKMQSVSSAEIKLEKEWLNVALLHKTAEGIHVVNPRF